MSGCGDKCGGCGGGCGSESKPKVSSFAPVKLSLTSRAASAPTAAVEKNSGGRTPGFRRYLPPFKVFFTWDIQYACNYRCSYCIIFKSPQWDSFLSKKDRPPIPAERWMEIWDDIHDQYGSAHIHCSGGEPFYYPRFIDILAHITKKHTMECDTNLSFPVDQFIDKVERGRFRFAPSFHPEFAEIGPYIEKCVRLRKAGYDLEGVNYICWPPHLKKIPEFQKAFNKIGVVLTLIPFRGSFAGKDYPDAYTPEERRWINQNSGNPVLSEDYGNWYNGTGQGSKKHENLMVEKVPQQEPEPLPSSAAVAPITPAQPAAAPSQIAAGPTPEPSEVASETAARALEEIRAHEAQKTRGEGCASHGRTAVNCRAGQMYAKIHPDGNALRCCFIDERGSMGNLIDGTFKLYDEPELCEYPACSCWKSMIVGEEGRWLRHWVGVAKNAA